MYVRGILPVAKSGGGVARTYFVSLSHCLAAYAPGAQQYLRGKTQVLNACRCARADLDAFYGRKLPCLDDMKPPAHKQDESLAALSSATKCANAQEQRKTLIEQVGCVSAVRQHSLRPPLCSFRVWNLWLPKTCALTSPLASEHLY